MIALARTAPLALLEKTAPPPGGTETRPETETLDTEAPERLFCARCHRLITEGRWRMAIKGGHEHTVFNPAGAIYEILCFKEAPGVIARGTPSAEFTWFKGYRWRVAFCPGCASHLGWRFEGAGDPQVFFGLIANRLTRDVG